MKTKSESILLENELHERLRIYKSPTHNSSFYLVIEDKETECRFSFQASDAEEITKAINLVVDSFS